MRALSILTVVLLVVAASAPAVAQEHNAPERLSPRMYTPVTPRTNAGEVQRITVNSRSLRRAPQVRSQRGVRALRMQPLQTPRLRTATPRLRVLRAPEGRFVRINGSYFRVTPSRLRR